MNIVRMRGIIRANGHLILDGTESKTELIEALRNLRTHIYEKCHRPYLGTPIDSLLPDINELDARSSYTRRNVRNVDMSSERL